MKKKIVILHGRYQSKTIIEKKMQKIFNSLTDHADIIALDAPNITKAPVIKLNSKIKRKKINANCEFKYWWTQQKNKETKEINAIGFDKSMDYLKKFFSTHQDIDTVIGFSQGASLLSLLASNDMKNKIQFNQAIFISGYESNCLEHQNIYKNGFNKDIESLHIYGLEDRVIKPKDSLKLANDMSGTIKNHSDGHIINQDFLSKQINSFLAV